MAVDEWPAVAGAAVASLYVQMAVTWPTSGRVWWCCWVTLRWAGGAV
jgi:hypothetical protein